MALVWTYISSKALKPAHLCVHARGVLEVVLAALVLNVRHVAARHRQQRVVHLALLQDRVSGGAPNRGCE